MMKDIIINFAKQSAVLFILMLIITSCEKNNDNPIAPKGDEGNYTLTVKYDTIRTYSGGGGIFLFKISPDASFSGKVKLSLEASQLLHASLTKTELTASDTVAEILIAPNGTANDTHYDIKLKLTHKGITREKVFGLKNYEWSGNYEDAKVKLEQFKPWFQSFKTNLLPIFDTPEMLYSTYPETLIVEHYTFLSGQYEVRLCYHVTVPQDSWSKLLIRRRGCWEPELALGISDGVHPLEMEISQYPIMYGY